MSEPTFTMGLEEEYLIVDAVTRELVPRVPESFVAGCRDLLGDRAKHEFLRCQIEINTRACDSAEELRAELVAARGAVSEVAGDHGYRLLASSSHPFSRPTVQEISPGEHYRLLAGQMRELVTDHFVICGMHVHVAIGDPDERVWLMNQAKHVLPYVLALTGSSPFWDGHDTGLHSYRVSVWDACPRTGLPPAFSSWAAYQRHVELLTDTGLLAGMTGFYWDLRPSTNERTIECRLPDVCTRLDDAVAVASLYRCWLRYVWRRGETVSNSTGDELILENRWLVQRDGVSAQLLHAQDRVLKPFETMLDEVLMEIQEDAEHFGCVAELEQVRAIAREGTSADRQRACHEAAVAGGCDPARALLAVTDLLLDETVLGT